MTIRKRVYVSGRVQGVFFRDSARQIANEHNLAGSARNLPDGRLEVVLEGPEESVAEVIGWIRTGPQLAHVEAVAIQDEPPEGMTGFSVA